MEGSDSHWAPVKIGPPEREVRAKIRCQSGFELEGVVVQEHGPETLVRDESGNLFLGVKISKE